MTHQPIFRPLSRDEIIEVVKLALPLAARSYKEMTHDTLVRMPEHWTQCRLAETLHRVGGMRVALEKRYSKLHEESHGKADIVLYDPGDGDIPRCVIEIKGQMTTWSSVKSDGQRLRALLSSPTSKIEFALMPYVSGEITSDKIDRDIDRFHTDAGIDKVIEVGRYKSLRTDSSDLWWFAAVFAIGPISAAHRA
jgi:hypothetical protein